VFTKTYTTVTSLPNYRFKTGRITAYGVQKDTMTLELQKFLGDMGSLLET
jgi:hypothetical protein